MKMKNKKILLIITIIIIIGIAITSIMATKISKKNREYEIEDILEYKYFVVKEENKYGVIDTKGQKIIDTKYEEVKIPNPEKPVFICYQDENTKILNEKNEDIFTEYENVEPLRLKNISSDLMYEKSTLKYVKDGKFGLIDFNGKKITKPRYEEIDTLQFKEGELLVKEEGKYGIINIKGTTLVKANYDKIETDKFYEEGNGYNNSGYIVSKITEQGYRYGYVDLNGKEIIQTKYNDLYRITEINSEDIYIICAENGKYGLIKNDKKIIENDYQTLNYIESNSTITAIKGKKSGVLSMEGEILVPLEFNQIDVTGEYIYATTEEGYTKIFDSNGKETNMKENLEIINIPNTDYKLYIETIEGQTKYNIYINERKITKGEYTYIQYLYENYFIVADENGKLGIIDENEKNIVEIKYNSIQKIEGTNMIQTLDNSTNTTEIYSKDMKKICEIQNATIERNKKYIKIYNDKKVKYISKEEKEVNNIELFTKNNIFAKQQGNKWGFVDKNGNTIVDYIYEKVTEENQYGFAGIMKNGKWGVINNNGEVIVNPTYEIDYNDPIFIGEYYQVVYGNGEIYYTK